MQPTRVTRRSAVPDPTHQGIERELTRLFRSGQHMHRQMQAPSATPDSLEKAGYLLLARLVETGPTRLTTLAEVACVDASTVSRQVGHLEAHGLVARSADAADGRAVLLRATDEGIALLTRTREARSRFIAAVVAEWPPGDRTEFGRLLARFNEGVARWSHIRQESS
ncbi:MAG: MarR family transcriptional regulator [Pseudonocardiales bacterium]